MDSEWVDEVKRHFGVVTDQIRSELQAVAEGQQATERKIDAMRAELAAEFREVKSLVRLSYVELERRIATVESELGDLRGRVDRLESRQLS